MAAPEELLAGSHEDHALRAAAFEDQVVLHLGFPFLSICDFFS